MSSHGEAGRKGGNPGDLYLHILVKPDKRFKRKDEDILSELNISIPQAVLGDTVNVETIHHYMILPFAR